MYQLIDTHAHLDELQDPCSAIEKARAIGVTAIVAVGSSCQSNAETLKIAHRHGSFVHAALGLHPCELADMGPPGVEEALRFIENNIAGAVAVGEIGLDYHKRVVSVTGRDWQKEVLQRCLEVAVKNDKPAIIHSRYAWKDALQVVQGSGIKKVVFHWFTGFSSVLRGIIDAGYFVSATPAAEYHEEHRRAVKAAPLKRILLETDSPVAYGREERYESQPADVLRSLKAVAELKGVDEDTVAEYTTRNALSLFSLL
ncbi:MAG: TatD family hydrolase [Dehalococcoidia bacterium]|nr:TatD family hydrolase [Dehalococcoidia bacterium]